MIALVLTLTGSAVMLAALTAQGFSRITLRQTWVAIVFACALMVAGIALESILYALVWLASIAVPALVIRHIGLRLKAKRERVNTGA